MVITELLYTAAIALLLLWWAIDYDPPVSPT